MPIVAPPLATTPGTLPTAGVAFDLDYRPQVNGTAYDPADNGGAVTRLQLFTTSARTGTATADVGPAAKVSTGVYRFSVPAIAAGTYYAIVTYTPSTGAASVLDVNDTVQVFAFGGEFGGTVVTLAEFKEHLNQSGTSTTLTDSELERYILAALEWVEACKGPVVPRAVTDYDATYRGRTLVLSQAPAISVASVTDAYGNAVDITTHTLNPAAGIVYLAEGSTFGTAPLTVVYTVGLSDVPAHLKLGILFMAEHFAQSQRPPGRAMPESGGRSRDAYFSALDVLGLSVEQANTGTFSIA